MGSETLVYDLDSHRVSCLNREAAAVFQACDGRRSTRQIARFVSRRLGSEVRPDYVALALQKLADRGLVESDSAPLSRGRREAVRRLAAGAGLAVPLVTSILAPEAAHAQSCVANGGSCTMSSQCCSGCCGVLSMMCRNTGPFMIGCIPG